MTTARQAAEQRIAANMSPDEKRRTVAIKQLYSRHVETGRDAQVESLYNRLSRNTQTQAAKLGGLVIMGKSGSGKTHLIRRMEDRPDFQRYRDQDEPDTEMMPYISIDAPPKASPPYLLAEVVRACGFPIASPGNVATMIDLTMSWFERRRVMFLHIDEFQHALRTSTEIQIKEIQDTIKELIQLSARWPVQIILSGTPALEPFRLDNDELSTRTIPYDLESLTPQDDVLMLTIAIGVIENHAGLRAMGLEGEDFPKQLLKASNYQFGNLVQIVRLACENAILRDQNKVDLNDFGQAYDLLVGRKGMDLNMFLSPNWTSLKLPNGIVDGTFNTRITQRVKKILKV